MSRYVRKTRDEWQVWGDNGYGWEEYCAENTRKEGLARVREYRANSAGAFELRHKRVNIEQGEAA